MKTIASCGERANLAEPPKRGRVAPSLSRLLGNVIDQLSSINLCCYQLRGVLPMAKMMDVLKEMDRLETAVLETIVLVEKLAFCIQKGPSASSPPLGGKGGFDHTADNVYPFSLNLKREVEEAIPV